MGKIIAIDFDGTLFVEDWPNIGKPIIDVIESAKAEQRQGAKLILNTLREGKLLEDAVAECEKYGLKFDAINDNLPEEVEKWGNNPRKIAATEYWDDRAVEFRPSKKAYKAFRQHHALEQIEALSVVIKAFGETNQICERALRTIEDDTREMQQ